MTNHEAAFYDAVRFLSKTSPRKLYNAQKLYSSFYLSKFLGKAIYSAKPFTLSVEPTTQCNLACPECPSGLKSFTRATGNMPPALFEKLLMQTHQHLLYLYFYFQGEPYMNRHFLDFVALANKYKVYSVSSTNAHFLTEEKAKKTIESGLDRLIISIDGTTQAVYENYRRNGSLDKVLRGTEKLLEAREKVGAKNPYLIFQFLVVKPNEHQIEEARILAKKMGIDQLKFKTAQIYDYEKGNPLIPENEKYARYKKAADGSYQLKNKLNNGCWKMWHANVVTWDGEVLPCCFDKDAQHKMGNIEQTNYDDILQNENFQNFRNQLLKSRKSIDICTNCTEGTKVWG